MIPPERQYDVINNMLEYAKNNLSLEEYDRILNTFEKEKNIYEFSASKQHNILFNINFFPKTEIEITNAEYKKISEPKLIHNIPRNILVNILCYYDYNCIMDGDLSEHVLYYVNREQYKTSKDTIYLLEKLPNYNYLVCCESFKILSSDEDPVYLSSRVISMSDFKIKNMIGGSEKEIFSYYYPLPKKYENIKNIISNPYDYFKKEFNKHMSNNISESKQ